MNRDITAYGTIAAELDHGAPLHADVWDLKPPGIFVAFLAARRAVAAQAALILLPKLIPSLVVLQEPNTEAFINACCAVAFAMLLRPGRLGTRGALGVGLLFAIGCLFKTVAIAMAAAVGVAYLALPHGGEPARERGGTCCT